MFTFPGCRLFQGQSPIEHVTPGGNQPVTDGFPGLASIVGGIMRTDT